MAFMIMINLYNRLSKPVSIATLGVVTSLFLFCDPLIKEVGSHPDNLMPVNASMIGHIILVFMLATIVSFLLCDLLVRYAHLHQHLTADPFIGKVQAFHLEPTPRIAGVAIFIATLSGCSLSCVLEETQLHKNFFLISLIMASIPAFCGGLAEDIFKNVGVAQRLLLTLISAAIAACIIDKGLTLYHVDAVWMDKLLSIEVISLLFTLFVVGGFTNAINLIDGYNGLVGGFMVVALTAITIAAFLVNDAMIASISIIMIGAILGFLAWNWPRGKIFLGDGGSYFIGFISAELCLLLLYHNPTVSPWFPLAIFIYPVFETLFTMFRRTFIHKTLNTEPDANHLHQMIFKLLLNRNQLALCKNQVKKINHDGTPCQFMNTCPQKMRIRNNRVAPYIWSATAINAVLAVMFMHSTIMLMGLCLASCSIYVLSYSLLTTKKILTKVVTIN
ncbi:MAG: hypothetical protein EXR38_01540 [Methylotenera sp.]|nr:hypothetical protein [Methylotenera sp.]MSP99188.1 hypothetical protein [Methylotenera sp.]